MGVLRPSLSDGFAQLEGCAKLEAKLKGHLGTDVKFDVSYFLERARCAEIPGLPLPQTRINQGFLCGSQLDRWGVASVQQYIMYK